MKGGFPAYRTVVYITDLNAYGKAHFMRYFEWEQKAQEEMLRQNIERKKVLSSFSKIEMITLEADTVYIKSARLFDEIVVNVEVGKVMEYSFQFLFRIVKMDTGELLSTGGKKIGFKERDSEKIIPLPASIRESLLNIKNSER